MEPFMVGGRYAKIDQFPHVLYMVVSCMGSPWSCGASVLNQNLVITAAHCLRHCEEDLNIVVYAGSKDITQMPVIRNIDLYLIHGAFNSKSYMNDIALGRTDRAIPLGPTIKRVVLESGFPRATQAQFAGWGVVDESTNQQAVFLRWIITSIRPSQLCRRFSLLPGMMCVQHNINNRPSLGTSGSALLVNNHQQIGLVSFRHTQRPELVIYTNLSYYYTWILRQARTLQCFKE